MEYSYVMGSVIRHNCIKSGKGVGHLNKLVNHTELSNQLDDMMYYKLLNLTMGDITVK